MWIIYMTKLIRFSSVFRYIKYNTSQTWLFHHRLLPPICRDHHNQCQQFFAVLSVVDSKQRCTMAIVYPDLTKVLQSYSRNAQKMRNLWINYVKTFSNTTLNFLPNRKAHLYATKSSLSYHRQPWPSGCLCLAQMQLTKQFHHGHSVLPVPLSNHHRQKCRSEWNNRIHRKVISNHTEFIVIRWELWWLTSSLGCHWTNFTSAVCCCIIESTS
jgi:hypothetical protein